MPYRVPTLATVLVAASLGGCTPMVELTRENVSNTFTCPVMVSRERPDLVAHQLDRLPIASVASQPSEVARWETPEFPEPPPAEIANDPERLAMWEDRRRAAEADLDRYWSIFEVEGCGHRVLVSCHRGRADRAVCNTPHLAPP